MGAFHPSVGNSGLRAFLLGILCLGCSDDPAGLRTIPGVAITVTPGALTLPVGATASLDATVNDLAGRPLTGRQVEWSSSAPAVVSVSRTGVVTALSPGAATVEAYSEQGVGFAHLVVQLDFVLPVSPPAMLITEIGTPTTSCPGGEGGLRVGGGRDCSHAGVSRYSLDFRSPEELPTALEVGAAADGTVSDVCTRPAPEATCGPDGPFVYVDHGFGFASLYSHLDPASITVRRKTAVVQGETLGRMGTWGEVYPWTHFELRYGKQDDTQRRVLEHLLLGGRKLTDYRLSQ